MIETNARQESLNTQEPIADAKTLVLRLTEATQKGELEEALKLKIKINPDKSEKRTHQALSELAHLSWYNAVTGGDEETFVPKVTIELGKNHLETLISDDPNVEEHTLGELFTADADKLTLREDLNLGLSKKPEPTTRQKIGRAARGFTAAATTATSLAPAAFGPRITPSEADLQQILHRGETPQVRTLDQSEASTESPVVIPASPETSERLDELSKILELSTFPISPELRTTLTSLAQEGQAINPESQFNPDQFTLRTGITGDESGRWNLNIDLPQEDGSLGQMIDLVLNSEYLANNPDNLNPQDFQIDIMITPQGASYIIRVLKDTTLFHADENDVASTDFVLSQNSAFTYNADGSFHYLSPIEGVPNTSIEMVQVDQNLLDLLNNITLLDTDTPLSPDLLPALGSTIMVQMFADGKILVIPTLDQAMVIQNNLPPEMENTPTPEPTQAFSGEVATQAPDIFLASYEIPSHNENSWNLNELNMSVDQLPPEMQQRLNSPWAVYIPGTGWIADYSQATQLQNEIQTNAGGSGFATNGYKFIPQSQPILERFRDRLTSQSELGFISGRTVEAIYPDGSVQAIPDFDINNAPFVVYEVHDPSDINTPDNPEGVVGRTSLYDQSRSGEHLVRHYDPDTNTITIKSYSINRDPYTQENFAFAMAIEYAYFNSGALRQLGNIQGSSLGDLLLEQIPGTNYSYGFYSIDGVVDFYAQQAGWNN